MKELILSTLNENKAEDVIVIPLHGKTDFADVMVIASGRSDRHVGALADKLITAIKPLGISAQAEGLKECNWVLVDAVNIIVHIFRPEVRSFYNLEKMWNQPLPLDQFGAIE